MKYLISFIVMIIGIITILFLKLGIWFMCLWIGIMLIINIIISSTEENSQTNGGTK